MDINIQKLNNSDIINISSYTINNDIYTIYIYIKNFNIHTILKTDFMFLCMMMKPNNCNLSYIEKLFNLYVISDPSTDNIINLLKNKKLYVENNHMHLSNIFNLFI